MLDLAFGGTLVVKPPKSSDLCTIDVEPFIGLPMSVGPYEHVAYSVRHVVG
jgi:hypothetical protein